MNSFKFTRTHAIPLSTLAAGAMAVAAVFWQGSSVEKVDVMGKKVDLLKGELHLTKLDVEVIDMKLGMVNDSVLEFAKAASAAGKGNLKEFDTLVAKIQKCKESGGQDCW